MRCYLETFAVVVYNSSLGDDSTVTEDDCDTAVIHGHRGVYDGRPDPACRQGSRQLDSAAVLQCCSVC